MAQVTVIGSINYDILSTMERAPKAGETVNGQTVQLMPGGKGLNQAVAARQQGVPVSFVGKVGQDMFGDRILSFFDEKGIDATHVGRSPDEATGSALILVDATAENRIVVIPAANRQIVPADADGLAISPGDILVSQFEVPRTTIAALFAKGRAAGARTLLNAAPALDDAPDSLWADTDILVVNETELGHFAGVELSGDAAVADIATAARRLLRRPDQVIIATLGVRGALAVTLDSETLVPGRKVLAVDTTGAGDCFVGSLSARLAAGDDLATAMRYANVAASIACTRVGTGTAMPVAEEVQAAL
ncbi:ribokinase [Niveispirillum cyanobacteriorum]|uniref:Ribokinase n=1 Tax=Niveispirillum cyanobacteriorum TaxID=1612173 RepID=A0A2K9NJT0_9PROT|nr:ribokinase [Niveispirillum cyanobacteriorum]AUN33340.1 ribokinase [Niveispirillum cyanobacteriorum]GGE49543.1 ribokinase [Niveispirillum cyanobacteriorum]